MFADGRSQAIMRPFGLNFPINNLYNN